jgi:hypothetical protein
MSCLPVDMDAHHHTVALLKVLIHQIKMQVPDAISESAQLDAIRISAMTGDLLERGQTCLLQGGFEVIRHDAGDDRPGGQRRIEPSMGQL